MWQQHLLTLALKLQNESRTDSYTQALKPISHLRADVPACPENCSRKLQDSFQRVCKCVCMCVRWRETVAECPRMKRYSIRQRLSWESECTRDCQHVCGVRGVCVCVYVGEGGISGAGKGYTTVKDGERERGNKERKRERVGSMQRFWAWSANWSFPLDHLLPGPVYPSLMERFRSEGRFTFYSEMPLRGQNMCINKTKQKNDLLKKHSNR